MPRRRATTSTDVGDQVVAWFERYLTHTKGKWAGEPFRLAPWQADEIVRPLFGTLNRDGSRQFRTALIGTPRKAGKSTLAAGIALRALFRDGEPGAEVYGCASDRDQAAIVYEMARSMVEASPALSSRAKLYRRAIVVPHTGASYKVLSADAFTKHGLNPHVVIFDELHAQPNRELWDVMTTGQGARRQPLTFAITTAGFDRESICFELYQYGRQLERRIVEDPTFFFRWWGAQEDENWLDEHVWERAHPGLGISVTKQFLRAEARQAENLPARQNTYRRLYLNQWVQQATRWLDLGMWDAAAGMRVDEDALAGVACWGGLDLASTQDLTALAWTFPDGDDGFATVWRHWLPEDRLADLDRRTGGQASVWVREGRLRLTPGNVTDYDRVQAQVEADAATFDVLQLAYDPWQAHSLVARLTDSGVPMVEFRQSMQRLAPATKDLERRVLAGTYRHGGDPLMRWQINNVAVESDAAGNIRPSKKRSGEKIDGVVAAVMALDLATRAGRPLRSVYEDRGLESV